MASLINNFLKQIAQGDQIKDWDHASRLFVANNYELSPKTSFSFHVFFDLNPNAAKLNGMTQTKQIELGMLVKTASLPKFSIQTKTLNAYNRPNVHQTKINYDPVNITFHDDSADVVRNFWYDYYNYYYRDSDYGSKDSISTYTSTHSEMSGPKVVKDWGYTIRNSTSGNNISEPYLSSIRIYSMYNKKFSEYILVNPLIKSFTHGEHNTASGTDTMAHQMTVEYEAVLYSAGYVGPGSIRGFGELHYDKRPSPLTTLGGGARSILGPGGIVGSIGSITSDLQSGNFLSAALKTARFGNNISGANLKAMAASEALKLGKDILSGSKNPQNMFYTPSIGSLVGAASAGLSSMVSGLSSKVSGTMGDYTGIASMLPTSGTGLPSMASLDSIGTSVTGALGSGLALGSDLLDTGSSIGSGLLSASQSVMDQVKTATSSVPKAVPTMDPT